MGSDDPAGLSGPRRRYVHLPLHVPADDLAAVERRIKEIAETRAGAVLGMCRSEIDLEERNWTCPAERMKTGRDHGVPLSDAMLTIIKPLRPLNFGYAYGGSAATGHLPI